jgi:RHS repeat-associated protein
MKNSFTILLFALVTTDIYSQSIDQNFISRNVLQVPITDTSLIKNMPSNENFQTIEYYDGLGRKIQTIKKQYSPTGYDFIQPEEYDNFGRQPVDYLPYSSANNDGSYKSNYKSAQRTFYSQPPSGVVSTTCPTGQSIFDCSPLNQIIEQGFAGEAWQIVDHNTLRTHNTGNIVQDSVRIWDQGATGFGSSRFFYPAGSLYKLIHSDENKDTTIDYTDICGKTVLIEHLNSGKKLRTYYLFDDFGHLRTVISPNGEFACHSTVPFTIDSNFLKLYCFSYNYDERGRLVEKQLPGTGSSSSVYDSYDRLTNTIDAKNQNIYLRYDVFNRQIEKGVITGGNYNPIEFTYYDNYDFNHDGTPDYIYQDDMDFPTNAPVNINTGRITGRKVQVLDGSNQWLTSAIFYDKYNRVIQTQEQNLVDGTDVITNGYDFVGKVLKTKQTHIAQLSGIGDQHVIVKTFDYDNSGRLVKTHQKIDSYGDQVISKLTYNELGQVIQKDLGENDDSTFQQSIHYGYNVRGWLLNINHLEDLGHTNELFAEEIGYEQPTQNDNDNTQRPASTSGLTTTTQFNGNISYVLWGMNYLSGSEFTTSKFSYSYQYDSINRLTQARFAEFQNERRWVYTDKYTESGITYDRNGNILTVNRKGKIVKTGQFADIDSLQYHYSGNQLTGIQDFQTIPSAYDFCNSAPYNPSNQYYSYDQNGDLTSDVNKGIVNIEYNALHLPQIIDMGNNNIIEYTYDALGNKLRKTTYINGQLCTTFDYSNGFVYYNCGLQYIMGDEGRIMMGRNGDFVYEYQIKDHLGDVRVCFANVKDDKTFTITQERSYYSFGLSIPDMNYDFPPISTVKPNEYQYNGKEFQEDFGLQWYDYGARFYDEQIARWQNIDPLCELGRRWTPYNYCNNNPIKFIDPDGMASKYNWETQRYENENGDEVSWDQVQQEYGITNSESYQSNSNPSRGDSVGTNPSEKKSWWNKELRIVGAVDQNKKCTPPNTFETILYKLTLSFDIAIDFWNEYLGSGCLPEGSSRPQKMADMLTVYAIGKIFTIGEFKINSEEFHREIKPEILKSVPNYKNIVGRNPDISIEAGKIILKGNGPFKGKLLRTGLEARLFFGK